MFRLKECDTSCKFISLTLKKSSVRSGMTTLNTAHPCDEFGFPVLVVVLEPERHDTAVMKCQRSDKKRQDDLFRYRRQ